MQDVLGQNELRGSHGRFTALERAVRPVLRAAWRRPFKTQPARQIRSRQCVEFLEPRYLMTAITWANAAGHTAWNDTASWVGGVVPTSTDTAVFASAATVVTPTLTANASIAGITIDNSQADYSLSGSTFTITVGSGGVAVSSPTSTTASTSTISAKVALSANDTFSAANNTGVNTLSVTGTVDTGTFRATTGGTGDIKFTGIVSNAGGFDVSGTGSVTLSGINTFTGGVNANAGTLIVQTKSAALGTGTLQIGNTSGTAAAIVSTSVGFTNAITVRSGSSGTATLENRNTSGTATVSGAITLNKSLTLQKGASTGGGLVTFSGGISGTGNLLLNNLAASGALTVATNPLNNTGTVTNSGSGAGTIVITGSIGANITALTQNSLTSSMTLQNNSTTFAGTVSINAGTLGVTPSVSTYKTQLGTGSIFLGNTSGTADATLNLNNSAIGGDVSNPLTVRAGSTGVLKIRYTSTSGSGVYRGAITLAKGLTIAKSTGGSMSVVGGITGTGNVTFSNEGTGALTVSTGSMNYVGSIINAGAGTSSVSITGGIGSNITGITQSSGTSAVSVTTTAVSLGGSFAIAGNGAAGVTISSAISAASAGTKTITHTGTGTGLLTLTGVVSNGSGTVAVTQNSATSSMVLSAANTYTGATNASVGTLLINGTTAAGSAVTVGNGGTLGGTGTANGAITVQTGGKLDPGAIGATGIFHTANLTLASGSTFAAQINTSTAGTGYDQASVVGTVNLTGATLSLSGSRPVGMGTQITLIANDSTDAVTGTFVGYGQGCIINSNGVAYRISYVGGTGNDVVLTDLGAAGILSPFGVAPSNSSINVVVSGATTTRFDSWAPLVDTAGVNWVRTFYNGSSTGAGVNDFTKWDHVLSVAAANHLNVSSGFTFVPTWIGASGYFPVNSTTHTILPGWTQYVTDVVTHTAGQVKYWEMWNEPPNFTTPTGSPTDYAAFVVATYDAIKAADPTAQVGLDASSQSILWLKQSIQAGAADHFDYITLHPYETFATLRNGDEGEFMSIVPSVQKMLADVDPAKLGAPVWFTEFGDPIGGSLGGTTITADIQAQELVKGFTMGLAQGVANMDWFEPLDGDSGQFGLYNNSYVIRQSGTAYTQLINYLGEIPNYVGWVKINTTDYGFAFNGVSNTVMVTWAPTGTSNTVNFGQTVTIVNPLTGGTSSASSYLLTDSPVFIVGVPTATVSQAATNKTLPFDWGGDYTSASSISTVMGATNTDTGLHQLYPNQTSTATTILGGPARYAGTSSVQNFVVDPNFNSYTPHSITITAVVVRDAANDNAGFNLWYESTNGTTSGFKAIGWNTVPSGATSWHTMSWTITDAQFVGKWGKSFYFNSDSTANSKYYIQSVTVTKNGPIVSASPAIANSSAADLKMNQLKPVITAAEQLWKRAGYNTSSFSSLECQIQDLPGEMLGVEAGNLIVIDSNAAGYGWSTSILRNNSHKMDLLTVLAHELGHELGFDHADAALQPVMLGTLGVGERRLPVGVGASHATAGLFSDIRVLADRSKVLKELL